jgi:hypothetical protein
MRILKSRLDQALAVLFVLSVAAIFLANEDPFARNALCSYARLPCFESEHAEGLNKIIYDLGIGSLISLMFYALIVRIPDFQRRRRIKRSLAIHYKSFKVRCICIFLGVVDGSYATESAETLLDQRKFKVFFQQPHSDSQSKWNALANNFNEGTLGDLVTEMELFRDEIAFVLNNADIQNEEVFEFLKRLSSAIYSIKRASLDYDSIKSLCSFLWQLFAGWDWVSGYRERDIIEETIEAI